MYFLRNYSFPLILAAALHAVVAAGLLVGWTPSINTETRVIKPQIISSKLIVLEAKSKPKAAPPKPKPMVNTPPPKPVEKPKPVPKVEPKPKEDLAAKKAAELEAQRKLEQAERQKRLDALTEQSFLDAVEAEASDLSEDAVDSDMEAENAAASFRMGIYQAIVGNWSRPPSARQGMQAKLLVELIPTGDVVTVTLLESSGNSAFDRSAESAVRKARRFEVPKDSQLFERNFRRFTLLFKPEDLLR